MNHYLVCGVHNYVMISCNAFRLNLKSLTLRKRLFYISVLFVYFVYLESVFAILQKVWLRPHQPITILCKYDIIVINIIAANN